MKTKIVVTALLSFIYNYLFCQTTVCAFRITDYLVKSNDSIIIVQLNMADGRSLKQNQIGILKGNFSNGDTSEIGWGKCHLIKGDYYYFGIHLKNKKRLPKANDLLYTKYEYDADWKGVLFNLMRHSISLKNVNDKPFISNYEITFLNKAKEDSIINLLIDDIKYTGKQMLIQNDNQDQKITGGSFDGKTLFAAMQTIEQRHVLDFLKYMIARPKIYAGNDWKISEIFATWMVSKTPTVIE